MFCFFYNDAYYRRALATQLVFQPEIFKCEVLATSSLILVLLSIQPWEYHHLSSKKGLRQIPWNNLLDGQYYFMHDAVILIPGGQAGSLLPILVSFWLRAPSAGLKKVCKVMFLQSCSCCVRTSNRWSVQQFGGLRSLQTPLARLCNGHHLCTERQTHLLKIYVFLWNKLIWFHLPNEWQGDINIAKGKSVFSKLCDLKIK